MMSYRLTVLIQKEDNWYVAKCVENNVASQGKTMEEAMGNLKEAVSLYYEDEDMEQFELPEQVFVTTMEVTV